MRKIKPPDRVTVEPHERGFAAYSNRYGRFPLLIGADYWEVWRDANVMLGEMLRGEFLISSRTNLNKNGKKA